MRRWLVLMMIVLLPLRGWAGDLMSVQMVMGAEHSMAMPADCPMQSTAAAPSNDIHEMNADAGSMTNCSSCDLCIP
ncbi:MAG: hypothetical protein ABW190_13830, partial [Rhizobacter sp.]